MEFLHSLINFILIAGILSLPFLMVALSYGGPTQSRISKLSVFATGMLCVPLLFYGWMHRDSETAGNLLSVEKKLAFHDALIPAREPVDDLKFSEFFKLPVGPYGLEITQRLADLDGKRVRIVGYMVQQELAKPGFFMLTPLPAKTSEADDSMADDLPPTTVFVHMQPDSNQVVAHRPGLLEFTGILAVGAKEETDTRVSSVRLMLDNASSHAVLAAN